MAKWTYDTNAGPIVTITAENFEAAKAKAVSQSPIANRRGYTVEWSQNAVWHVARVFNTRGRRVHAFAIRPGTDR